jgi:hypothetical protein
MLTPSFTPTHFTLEELTGERGSSHLWDNFGEGEPKFRAFSPKNVGENWNCHGKSFEKSFPQIKKSFSEVKMNAKSAPGGNWPSAKRNSSIYSIQSLFLQDLSLPIPSQEMLSALRNPSVKTSSSTSLAASSDGWMSWMW